MSLCVYTILESKSIIRLILYSFLAIKLQIQKQPFADVLQNRCSCKFCNIHRETPVLESLFSPNAGKYRPEKLRIRTLFTQCKKCYYERFAQNILHETDHLKNLKKQSDQLTSWKAKFLTDSTNFKSKRHRAFFFVLFFLVTMQIQPKINTLSAKPTKHSNTLKQFVAKLPTNCLNAFDHFVGSALKGLN